MGESAGHSLEGFYRYLWPEEREGDRFAVLDPPPGAEPPSGDFLLRAAAELGFRPETRVLDIGCGNGKYACELARVFDCRVVGLDPLERNLRQAQGRAAGGGLERLVTFQTGSMEALPFAEACFDFLWCVDVLSHVRGLDLAFQEAARVLKPGGGMLLYCSLATELLEPEEARRIYAPLAIAAASMSRAAVEESFEEAGLRVVGSEAPHREHSRYFEPSEAIETREFVRLARMLRERDRFAAELGRVEYDYALAHYLFNVYLAIGKIDYHLYMLRKSI